MKDVVVFATARSMRRGRPTHLLRGRRVGNGLEAWCSTRLAAWYSGAPRSGGWFPSYLATSESLTCEKCGELYLGVLRADEIEKVKAS